MDGLRAVAIVVVVLYHAGVSLCSGGFVGVDVFFVISGWLITQQLLVRSEGGDTSGKAAGKVGLLDFWARRIRRLVPAAVCMIVGTTILSWLFLSPLDWRLISTRGAAAALYVSNLLFAHSAGNYFTGTLKTSPYLHTWSLSLEEQFYLFWPFVFVGGMLVARSFAKANFRRVLLGVMGVVLVVSFALNLRQTNSGSPWAFFGLPARAWEFALAGIVAILLFRRAVIPRRFAEPLALAGLVLVLYAVVTYDDATKFPGTAVIVPVVGTMLLLLAGHAQATDRDGRASAVIRSLGWRPVVVLGLLSYSWYLWHWPLMIITTQALSRNSVGLRLAAAAVALGVAALSYRFVENPVRFSKRLKASLGRTYALGAGLVIVALAFNGALYLRQRTLIQQEPYATYQAARTSFSNPHCTNTVSEGGIGYCVSGATDSDRTVLLTGDSHALQWMTAFGAAAEDLGVRAILRQSGNCSAATLRHRRAVRAACAGTNGTSGDPRAQLARWCSPARRPPSATRSPTAPAVATPRRSGRRSCATRSIRGRGDRRRRCPTTRCCTSRAVLRELLRAEPRRRHRRDDHVRTRLRRSTPSTAWSCST
ncbi:MAG: acyltransferase family protein [Acidimicrobiia bacterium]